MYQMEPSIIIPDSTTEAAACFLNAVEMADYRMACYSLAMMYMEGKGVDASLSERFTMPGRPSYRAASIAETAGKRDS